MTCKKIVVTSNTKNFEGDSKKTLVCGETNQYILKLVISRWLQ